MRCVKCGGQTKVTDSRDDRNERNDWLLRAGVRVFGWWTSDVSLRKRKCLDCGKRETTIEITLSDLEDSFEDLRKQLTITEADVLREKGDCISQDDLDSLVINMNRYPMRTASELEITRKTLIALALELLYRRERQKGAQQV